MPYQLPASPGLLEQTLFVLLASLAGLAFLVVIGLLLCKFQVDINYKDQLPKTMSKIENT